MELIRISPRTLSAKRNFLPALVASALLLICGQLAAQSPRQFTWQFQNDSNHKPGRTWTQVGPSLWTEVYQSGMHHFFEVNNPSVNVGGNTGQIVESDNHDIEVFIPDLSATGPNHDWILARNVGTAGWSNLGQITPAQ